MEGITEHDVKTPAGVISVSLCYKHGMDEVLDRLQPQCCLMLVHMPSAAVTLPEKCFRRPGKRDS